MHLIFRIYDKLIYFLGELAGYLIGLMAIGIATDVIWRDLGFGGIHAMLDLVQYGILVVTMAGAAYVLRIGRHVRIDLVTSALPEGWRKNAEIAAYLFAFVITAVLTFYGLKTTIKSYQAGAMLYLAFDLAEWIPLAAVPVGMTLVMIECARKVWFLWSGLAPTEKVERAESI